MDNPCSHPAEDAERVAAIATNIFCSASDCNTHRLLLRSIPYISIYVHHMVRVFSSIVLVVTVVEGL